MQQEPILLRKNAKDTAVTTLQQLLNASGANPPLTVNGEFGPETEAAVKMYQSTHVDANGKPLLVDGEVGEMTWWSLQNNAKPIEQRAPLHLAGPIGHRIVQIALGEALRGVREHGHNTGSDVIMYQRATSEPGTGWKWCAAFVTWVYEKAGLQLRNAGGFIGVADLKSWGRKTGKWHARVPGYVAPPGSIVIFKFSHTGIVVQGSERHDLTVEGNTSSGGKGSQRDGDGVFQRTRGHSLISGYIVLDEILPDAFGACSNRLSRCI